MGHSRFCRSEDGYVMALTLISMPMLLGLALLIIDVARGNNLHTDLQNAVDALALAGARELDGGTDATDRADAVINTLLRNQARFSDGGSVIIDESEVTVIYLSAIPASDDNPIDADFIADNTPADQTEANYVLVRSDPRPITSLWPVPVTLTSSTVNMQAEAVATYTSAACDITPLFMCNPFESQDLSMEEAFQQGMTYSREIRLLKTSATPGPGNFGLLDTNIPLRQAFGRGVAGACYSKNSVTTKPGVTLGHVNSGLNVRFDIYSGALNKENKNPDYRPAKNVRKGADKPLQCGKFAAATDGSAMGFPAGQNYDSSLAMSGPDWDRSAYWSLNHGGSLPQIPSSSHPTDETKAPSRYDVYRYEIEMGIVGDKAGGKTNGESGVPHCYKGEPETITDSPDRRMIFAAVVNCGDFSDPTKHETINGKTTLKPDSFVSMFLTNPIEKEDKTASDDSETAAEKPIRLEIVDVTGFSGNGSLDLFLREESVLVR